MVQRLGLLALFAAAALADVAPAAADTEVAPSREQPAPEAALAAPITSDAGAAEYAEALVAAAHRAKLHRAEQWLRLGHFQQRGWSNLWFVGHLFGKASEADGEALFLAPNGATSPRAELDATLRAFAQPAESWDEHAMCRFPARLLWLRRALDIDIARLLGQAGVSEPPCPGFSEFVTALRPEAVVVVFSSYYMSKAASAFGHTFFRIEKRAKDSGAAQPERRELLDMGIDYSADVTTSNAMLYAIWGMTGGFRGSFRKLPYYYKVREYNDYESRDLWEYRLNLSDEQLALFVAHLWELGHTYFDYFYLTENCSYHILGAIEVANPEWDLLAKLKTPVVPVDTIVALTEVPDLVAEVSYRPSLMTQFRARTAHMSGPQLDLVEALVDDPEAALPASLSAAQHIEALDAAADLMDIEHGKQIILEPESEPAQTKFRILVRRASMGATSAALEIAKPHHLRPERGHGSRRVGLAAGVGDDADPYLALSFRANLHDLLDPVAGYPELSQMEFLPLEVRSSLDDAEVWLERISLLRITHLNPVDRFNRRMTWKLDMGARRIRDAACEGCLAASFVAGGGATYAWLDQRVAAFATVDGQVSWSPDLDGVRGAPVRVGVGPQAGLRLRWHPRLVSLLSAHIAWLPEQPVTTEWAANAQLRWAVGRSIALDFSFEWTRGEPTGQAGMMFYY